jgi:hypothetical protein
MLLEHCQLIVRCVLVLNQVKVLQGNCLAYPRVELSQRFLLTPELKILALTSLVFPLEQLQLCCSEMGKQRCVFVVVFKLWFNWYQ